MPHNEMFAIYPWGNSEIFITVWSTICFKKLSVQMPSICVPRVSKHWSNEVGRCAMTKARGGKGLFHHKSLTPKTFSGRILSRETHQETCFSIWYRFLGPTESSTSAHFDIAFSFPPFPSPELPYSKALSEKSHARYFVHSYHCIS